MKPLVDVMEKHTDRAEPSLGDLYRWRWRPRWRLQPFRLLTRAFDLLTAWLPDIARLAQRQTPPVIRALDYAEAAVRIHADTWVEYAKRAHSCAKEPEPIEWLETYIAPGDVVYDIGANVGA